MVRAISLNVRGLQLVLLAVAMAIAGYVRTAMSPLQEAMRMALGLTDNQMALLQGPSIGIPVILMAIPLGLLIDRISRVRLLLVLVVLSTLGTLLTALASDFGVLLFARGLAGLTALGIVPVVFSLLADHYPPAQRGWVTTAAIVGQVTGNAAAFALGGALLGVSGAEVAGWRSAMFWMAAPLVPAVMLMLAMREPARDGVVIQNPTAHQVWLELRQYRAQIAPLVIGIILAEVAIGGTFIWASPMFSRTYQLAPGEIGAIMAVGMLVSGIVGPVLAGPLADICQRTGGPRRTMMALSGLAILCVPASLFAFVPSVTVASALLVAVLMLMHAIVVMGMALFTIVIPNEIRGLCMSVLVAAEILFALAVGPPAVSLLSGALGGLAMIGKALSMVCVIAAVFAAAAFLLGLRRAPSLEPVV